MSDLGKIDREFFDRVIYPRLGAERDDVRLGPKHGVDFGVVDVGGRALVVATDPLSVLPGLGFERAGKFALDVVLADVAVSGLRPAHLSVSFSLPPSMSDDEFECLWTGVDARARSLGVNIVTGHTARYSGVEYPWVGGATAMAVGDPEDLVRPDGARPGDALVASTGPGAEMAGLFATLFPERLSLPAETVAVAQERLDDAETVEDASTVVEAGAVSAMHDATECGVQGGLVEMAESAGARFDVDRDAMPVAAGVEAVCDAVDVDPWRVTSSGTLLAAVAAGDASAVVDALRDRGTPAAVVGRVSSGDGVYVGGRRVEHPEVDPSWEAYARLAGGE